MELDLWTIYKSMKLEFHIENMKNELTFTQISRSTRRTLFRQRTPWLLLCHHRRTDEMTASLDIHRRQVFDRVYHLQNIVARGIAR